MPNYMMDDQDKLKDYSFTEEDTDTHVSGEDIVRVPANDERKFLFVQVLTGETIGINFGDVADTGTPGSIVIKDGEPFSFTPWTFISSKEVHMIVPGGVGAIVTVKEGSL